jgi:hypothetical protein
MPARIQQVGISILVLSSGNQANNASPKKAQNTAPQNPGPSVEAKSIAMALNTVAVQSDGKIPVAEYTHIRDNNAFSAMSNLT